MLQVEKIVVGLMRTNCYVIKDRDTSKFAIIDPGHRAKKLDEKLNEYGFENCEYILLTHGHFDHIGAVKALQDQYHVPVYVSRQEEEDVLTNTSVNLTGAFGLPYILHGTDLLRDGEEVDIIGTKIKCLLTPGHTSGGMSYYCEELASVIVGDTLFHESVGRTDFPTGSASTLVRSIQEQLFTLPDETKVFPGHMSDTTIGWEKKYNPFCGGVL